MVEVLAIVPARGGSKGLPGKNLRPLSGHPLLAYSVSAGVQSKLVNRVICSTDSEEIAEVAIRYGAEIPFMRPAELARDESTDLEFFTHAIDELGKTGYRPDIIVQLRPTDPIRRIGLVDEGIQLLIDNPEAHSVRTITDPAYSPYKMWTIDKVGRINPLLTMDDVPEPFNLPRQQLPKVWWHIGVLDLVRTDVVTQKKSLSGTIILPIIIDRESHADIDTLLDFEHAERLVQKINCVKPRAVN
ncbi:MAG: acylneuraminate cytidylyltransferase family protein [Chloroflexota bacterium]|nr:acylneuraminate cytidylyltransferase family protein [Chloroflexota bacterium]